MTTEKLHRDRSNPIGRGAKRRCSICGETMTAPQRSLSMDGKRLCDACYRDCFFADMNSHRHLTLDRCDI